MSQEPEAEAGLIDTLLIDSEKQRKTQGKSNQAKPCKICNKKSNYQCPKCKILYCSLDCYKKHSETCTEEFYKENVMQVLKNRKASLEQQQQMKKLLKEIDEKYGQDEYLDEEMQLPSEKTRLDELEQMLQKQTLSLDKLTIKEQEEFSRFITNAKELNLFLKPWKPWWTVEAGISSLLIDEVSTVEEGPQKLINEDYDEENLEEEEKSNNDLREEKSKEKYIKYRKEIKERCRSLPDFDKLCKKAPSPELKYHLINILFGECFMFRLFNGDVKHEIYDSVEFVLSVSKCLSENKENFSSIQNVLAYSIQNSIEIERENTNLLKEIIIEDLCEIYKSKFLLLESLFRLYDLFHLANERALEEEKSIETAEEIGRQKKLLQKISKIKQKLLFFLSMVKNTGEADLKATEEQLRELLQRGKSEKEFFEKLNTYKKLDLLV